MIVYYKNKKINLEVKKVSSFGKIFGLMFRPKNTPNLLFAFKKNVHMPIHSYFVFFKFLVLWTDDKNKIIDWKIVKPFKPYVCIDKPFYSLIELPLNKKNRRIIEFFVGKERFK